jgi:DNA polymerase-3 subunit alpha
VPKKALLITGEVNLGEDKPKIFPQDIIALEDAPHVFTKAVHLRLQMAHLTAKDLEDAKDLLAAYPGKCPLFLCLKWPSGEVAFVEAHEKYRVKASMALQVAIDVRFGELTYYAKVDSTLPQRTPRQWEKRSQGGNGED